MAYIRETINVEQDPAKSLGKGIKNPGATSTADSELDREVVSTLPVDAKELPQVQVIGKDLEGAGDIGHSTELYCMEKLGKGMRLLKLGTGEQCGVQVND